MERPGGQDVFGRLEGREPGQITPREAYYLACRLGPLAYWILVPEVLRKAEEHRAELFQEHAGTVNGWAARRHLEPRIGICWLLVANADPNRYPWVRPAFVLPVRWRPGKQHDPSLPLNLRQLADDVLQTLRSQGMLECFGGHDSQWCLVAYPEGAFEETNLEDLPCSFESAWVSLAGGLLLACRDALPRPTVFVSASFGKDGLVAVQFEERKLQAALELGAKEFYVVEQQVAGLQEWVRSQGLVGVQIGSLPAGKRDVRECLQEYLFALEVPPPAEAAREKRKEYFLRIPNTRQEEAEEYYYNNLLPEIARDLQENFTRRGWQVTHCVSILSPGFCLSELLVGATQPEVLILFYGPNEGVITKRLKQFYDRVTTSYPNLKIIDCRLPAELTKKNLEEYFRKVVSDLLAGVPPRQILFDLTAGKKIMSLSLYDVIPAGAICLCAEHKFDNKTRRPIPFTEKWDIWEKI
jgi:hypothetical protein